MSEIRSFKTAPPIGSDISYKFIVYGDMGMSDAAHATAKYALRDIQDGYEFIYHHGDISYARGYVRSPISFPVPTQPTFLGAGNEIV